MTESFTPNDLVRYIYQETTAAENEKFVQALQFDLGLAQEYSDMLNTISQLDCILLEPSESVVNAIKKRSHSTGLEKV